MRTLLLATFALGSAAFGAAAFGTPLSAQSVDGASGAVGRPWFGCWEAADGLATKNRVCVIPSGARDLRIVSLDEGGATSESTLRLGSERTLINQDGCEGWEQARVSADGERILVDSELKCGDLPKRKVATAFVITPSGFWVQATGSGYATISSARIRVYRPAESYAAFPAAIRASIAPFVAEAEHARYALADRRVSAADLMELEALKVATPLIDLIVAASYPRSFTIDAQSATVAAAPAAGSAGNRSDAFDRMALSPFFFGNGFPMFSAIDMARLQSCVQLGGFVCGYGGFGLGTFGGFNGFGNQFGFGPFGNRFWGGFDPFLPIGLPVVVRPSDRPSDVPGSGNSGRAVSGRGYTANGGNDGSRTASPRGSAVGTSIGGSGSTGASSNGGSGTGSTGSTGSSGASSSGGESRTAKPRTP